MFGSVHAPLVADIYLHMAVRCRSRSALETYLESVPAPETPLQEAGERRLAEIFDLPKARARVERAKLIRQLGSSPPHLPARTHKTGRNAPCPCGSGRKYKKCCLRKTSGPLSS